ncbi:winged helix-turn-helix domain-containing protein [Terriglobus sp. ADX1]|uniref:winged helix-turn-helix domain-containing protein n=1 Tax=Terriglobus sp. ADX1 TaxID=2794063 RepID=UPI002FE6583F
MPTLPESRTQLRFAFGLFEADLAAGELWRAGHRIKVQALPFKVLAALLKRPGEVVSREQLHIEVWGPDVVVDFEHALSNAIKKLREALGDSADNPRFIETLSRRGFRFIAPVRAVAALPDQDPVLPVMAATVDAVPVSVDGPIEDVQTNGALTRPGTPTAHKIADRLLMLLCGLVAGATLWAIVGRRHIEALPRIAQVTQDGTIYSPKVLLLGTLSAVATDGSHLFTPANEDGRIVLSQISLSTGARQVVPLPSEIGVPEVEDISPAGTQLLLRSNLGAASQQPLWIVPIDGGSAFKVSDVIAQAATWMPDGRNVLYTSGDRISVVSLDTGRSTLLATVPGRAFWPRWSRDGKLLRFTMIDAVHHTSSLWQLAKGESTAHNLLKSWDGSGAECCGVWTADGTAFVFEATRDGTADLWKMGSSLGSDPIRITNGPLNFKAPVAGRTGAEIFFVGQDIRSRLERYDAAQKHFLPVEGFLATADHVTYSRDGRWVAWTDSTSRLWRARSDGAERVVLTPPSMQVFMESWSPDDTQIAFMARGPKQPWQIFTIPADGGTPMQVTQENRNFGDPSYSADGKYITMGIVPELMGDTDASNPIRIMELATRHVTTMEHSQGLYSPKWSPDGRFIAALTQKSKTLMLYDTATSTWKTLLDMPADHPVWSNDSKSIVFRARAVDKKPIYRISVPDGRLEEVADLSNFNAGTITLADFSGIMPDGVPLMHVEVSSGNLYAINLKSDSNVTSASHR